MWICIYVKCEYFKLWIWENLNKWKCEYVKMWICENLNMWKWENVNMLKCEYVKMGNVKMWMNIWICL